MRELAGHCGRCGKPVEIIRRGMHQTIDGVTVGLVLKEGRLDNPGELYHYECRRIEIADLPWKTKTTLAPSN